MHLFLKISSLFLAAFLLCGVSPGFAQGQDGDSRLALSEEERRWLAEHPVLRVGADAAFAPLDFADAEGRHAGVAAGMLELVRQRLGVRLEVAMPISPDWHDTVQQARARKLDMLSCVAITERRKEFLLFSDSYVSSPSVLATRADSPPPAGLAALWGKTFAVVEGYYTYDRLRHDYPHLPLLLTASPREALEAVALGKAHAALDNLATASQAMQDLRRRGLEPLQLVPAVELGQDWFHFGVRSDWPMLVQLLNKALADIDPAEARAVQERWITAPMVPLKDASPGWLSPSRLGMGAALLGLTAAALGLWNILLRRRIRRRRAAEGALLESEARVAMILAATGDGLWRCDLADGVCHFSPGWFDLMGALPHAGEHRWEMFEARCHPEDLPLLQALRRGERLDGEGRFREEIRARLDGGQWRWVLMRGRAMARDRRGAPQVLAGVVSDLTLRKQTEASLVASEIRARMLFDESPVSLWEEDHADLKRFLDGLAAEGVSDARAYFEAHPQALRYAASLVKVVRVNAATLALFEAESEALFQREGLVACFTEESCPCFLAELEAHSRGEAAFSGESVHITATGRRLRTLVHSRLTTGSRDDWRQVIVSVQDVTAIKEAEELREDVDRITKHDLKGPLSACVSLPRLLLEDDNLTPDQRKALALLRDTGVRMLSLINLSLDLYKMERGLYQLDPRPVDALGVAAHCLDQSRAMAAERGVSLRLTVHGASPGDGGTDMIPWILGEDMLVYSMLSNLVQNAVEASGPGDEVTVDLGLEPDGEEGAVALAVHNPGVVPEGVRDHLFDKHVTSKKGGTGLGAYSARRMAETMGGHLFLTTSREAGTTIRAVLPAAPA